MKSLPDANYDDNRSWILAVARGEIVTHNSPIFLNTMLASIDYFKKTDPELYEALKQGNEKHPERLNDVGRPTWQQDINADPLTADALTRILAEDRDLTPEDIRSWDGYGTGEDDEYRRMVLTPASEIPVKRARWLWDQRLALGTLGLLAGNEGLGKSTLAYDVAARITRGELPGEYVGKPKGVLICATEDSWECTIVPRLMAHNADLTRVYRVEVEVDDDIYVGLSLPADLDDVKRAALDVDAALMILDPLMSRLAPSLDPHKDGEVRRALEPLVAVAGKTDMSILGLIHFNKSGSTDPLQLVMASKAFTAVARSVHTVVLDPEDEASKRVLFGTPKNNLGRTDLPTLTFTINGWTYEVPGDDVPGETGKLSWGEDSVMGIREALAQVMADPESRSATLDAQGWLEDYMSIHKVALSQDVLAEGKKHGNHAPATLKRARVKAKIATYSHGFPRRSYWSIRSMTPDEVDAWIEAHPDSPDPTDDPTTQSDDPPVGSPDSPLSEVSPGQSSQITLGESDPIDLTDLTDPTGRPQSDQSDQSDQWDHLPPNVIPLASKCATCGGAGGPDHEGAFHPFTYR